jgi:hypothetical protein
MQRSDEKEASSFSLDDLGVDAGDAGDDSAVASGPSESGAAASRRGRLGRAFSPKSFGVLVVLLLAGMFLGGAVPVVGFVGRFLGLFAVAFAVGLVSSRRRYLEVGLAGALASGLGFVLGTLTSVFAPFAVQFLADYGAAVVGVGAGAGVLASLAGHYFGRDLRDGLTREI